MKKKTTYFKMAYLLVLTILSVSLLAPAASAAFDVIASDVGTNYIRWTWATTPVTGISVDGLPLGYVDPLSTTFILSDINPGEWHVIIVSAGGDSGTNTTRTLTPTWSNTMPMANTFYNQSYTLSKVDSTPWELWIASGIIGLGLFLLSLRPRNTAMELEVDAIISVVSLIPIGFCASASFNIDRITGYGVTNYLSTAILMEHHTLYSFPIIGMLVSIFLLISIGNLFRIIAQHKIFRIRETEPPATSPTPSPIPQPGDR
jgi:hypothetical protein